MREFVEDELVTDSGLRENIALEQAQKKLAQLGASATAIDELVKRRLLHLEERLKIKRVELAHDVLTPVIKESRDQRQQQEAVVQAEQRAREAREKVRRQRKKQRLVVAGMAAALLVVSSIGTLISVQLWQLKKERASRRSPRSASSLRREPRRCCLSSRTWNHINKRSCLAYASFGITPKGSGTTGLTCD